HRVDPVGGLDEPGDEADDERVARPHHHEDDELPHRRGVDGAAQRPARLDGDELLRSSVVHVPPAISAAPPYGPAAVAIRTTTRRWGPRPRRGPHRSATRRQPTMTFT